jgi:hypothetical protein
MRLQLQLEDEPRLAFLGAVRAYASAAGSNRQAWLLEAVIRTSRTIATDSGALPEDIHQALIGIQDRFQILRPQKTQLPLANYSDARKLIMALFF